MSIDNLSRWFHGIIIINISIAASLAFPLIKRMKWVDNNEEIRGNETWRESTRVDEMSAYIEKRQIFFFYKRFSVSSKLSDIKQEIGYLLYLSVELQKCVNNMNFYWW